MVEIVDNNGNPVQDPNRKETLHYWIDKKLVKWLKSIKSKITKKDKDYVLIMDGYEGSGKSTLAQQIGKYVDYSLDLPRICMTADEFKVAIIEAHKGQCVIYDEAVTGMASGDSITRIGRLLKSMMMQMRQKNLFVIVIIPTIFEMGKYAVLSRARALIHVYEKGESHRWVAYNKKDLKKLYLKGKKTYSYRVRSFFIGTFGGKMVVDEQKYRNKKEKALFALEKDTKSDKMPKETLLLIEKALKIAGHGAPTIQKVLLKMGIKRSDVSIWTDLKNFKVDLNEIKPKTNENEENDLKTNDLVENREVLVVEDG